MASILSITYKPLDRNMDKSAQGFNRIAVNDAHLIVGYGIEGDRKGGHPKRQLNVLSTHTLDGLRADGYAISAGAIGEQMVIGDIDVDNLPIGTRLHLGDDAIIEITSHREGCLKLDRAHGKTTVDDARPLGVMAKVIQEGHIRVGDAVTVLMGEMI
jgi:MOSC domain-containing protein YiiM